MREQKRDKRCIQQDATKERTQFNSKQVMGFPTYAAMTSYYHRNKSALWAGMQEEDD